MKTKIKNTANTLLKQSMSITYTVISTIIVFFIFGIIINIFSLIFLYGEIKILLFEGSVVSNIIGIFIIFLFLFFLPFVYLFFGKKHGIQKAVLKIISQKKSFITEYLLDKLFERINNKENIRKKINEIIPLYFEKINNMPLIMRIIFNFLARYINFIDIIKSSVDEQSEEENFDMKKFSQSVSVKVNEALDDKFFSTDLTWLWILMFINIFIVILVKILI
ncbi:MAG: hypothetical protein HQK76_07740 [Desulfobacterales bacterium]|nr:hypothetical protein [Desulfobacterales bacterium]